MLVSKTSYGGTNFGHTDTPSCRLPHCSWRQWSGSYWKGPAGCESVHNHINYDNWWWIKSYYPLWNFQRISQPGLSKTRPFFRVHHAFFRVHHAFFRVAMECDSLEVHFLPLSHVMDWYQVFWFFRGSPGATGVCALCSTCSDFLGPVPSMCWQSPDSLSWHVGMGTVDWGFFKVAGGRWPPKESDSPRGSPNSKGVRLD